MKFGTEIWTLLKTASLQIIRKFIFFMCLRFSFFIRWVFSANIFPDTGSMNITFTECGLIDAATPDGEEFTVFTIFANHRDDQMKIGSDIFVGKCFFQLFLKFQINPDLLKFQFWPKKLVVRNFLRFCTFL